MYWCPILANVMCPAVYPARGGSSSSLSVDGKCIRVSAADFAYIVYIKIIHNTCMYVYELVSQVQALHGRLQSYNIKYVAYLYCVYVYNSCSL